MGIILRMWISELGIGNSEIIAPDPAPTEIGHRIYEMGYLVPAAVVPTIRYLCHGLDHLSLVCRHHFSDFDS